MCCRTASGGRLGHQSKLREKADLVVVRVVGDDLAVLNLTEVGEGHVDRAPGWRDIPIGPAIGPVCVPMSRPSTMIVSPDSYIREITA